MTPPMTPPMTIHAKNTSQMCDIIASLVASGLGFEADGATLTITLTGAH